ncbi:MAG TPA: alanine-zipper protein [Stellaceae bacterium]|nr:alanine-zipper protein [Stellaceae bacterium]
MRNVNWKKSAGFMVVAGALLVGACASQDSVTKAQATADQALQQAQLANQRADAANARADAADKLAADANAKSDRMYQQNLKK